MLLKTISALTSIILLATSATAVPWGPTRGPTRVSKLGLVPKKTNMKDAGSGSRSILSCEAPPLGGNITYLGGRILEGNVNIYYIFYGNWTVSQKSILIDFSKNIGGSDYSNIETTYGATGKMTFAGSINDNYSLGKDLGDNLPAVVQNALKKGLLPSKTNAVYFVLSSPDVTEGSFCSGYCGYHGFAPIKNTTIAYAFIGNPLSQCMDGCGPCNPTVSPNGDIGVDAMVSVVAHELMETISDPEGKTWRDKKGNENADKCAWHYGNTKKLGSGAAYNVVLGQRKYLIQQNWNAKTQRCAISATKE